jgi:hypothetical protein
MYYQHTKKKKKKKKIKPKKKQDSIRKTRKKGQRCGSSGRATSDRF